MSGSLAGVRALVVTASTRAAAGVYPDRGGPIIVAELTRWGAAVTGPVVVPDGPPVAAALGEGVTAYDLIITTGGTGCSPTDATPEATRAVIDREIPGVAEAIRADGVARGIPTAMISRGVAGVVGQCVIINLPGSSGGVRDGLRVLEPVLGHLVSQVRGGDH
ncbi:MogA/MoaB family molybdenum cofactor biosynthesis protein [Nostocoides sp.]|uniref:MogA/MoaB family molybdenum cofactor biosynthesis protein n=2 Tax=Nostocoides sp. TaxID=1917966 RepID=UPI002BCACE5F|nr:MogA/MoaB family molybdenum cofactor biosynthesis protein [Tetrasphaera sp.]